MWPLLMLIALLPLLLLFRKTPEERRELEDFIEGVLYVSDQHLEEEMRMEDLELMLDEEEDDEL